jgi:hypothetical protein
MIAFGMKCAAKFPRCRGAPLFGKACYFSVESASGCKRPACAPVARLRYTALAQAQTVALNPACKRSTIAENKNAPCGAFYCLAERTGLEPATPGVTGRYSNQLNYRSKLLERC